MHILKARSFRKEKTRQLYNSPISSLTNFLPLEFISREEAERKPLPPWSRRNITRYEREKEIIRGIRNENGEKEKWNYTGKSKPAFLSPPPPQFVREPRYRRGIVRQIGPDGNNVATNGYVPFCKLAGRKRAGQI